MNNNFIKQLAIKYNLQIDDPYAEVPQGWENLLEDLVKDICNLNWDRKVSCIKEKFGGLRFYIDRGSSEVHNRIRLAEQKSTTICEFCGNSKGNNFNVTY